RYGQGRGDDAVRSIRCRSGCSEARGNGARGGSTPPPDSPRARKLPRTWTHSCGATPPGRSLTCAVPDKAAILVLLWTRDRDALFIGLGAKERRRMGQSRRAESARVEQDPQPYAEEHLQRSCDDRGGPARERAAAPGLQSHAGRRNK